MKILHVIPTYKPAYIYGGPVISASKLCESLATIKGVEVRMLTTDGNGEALLDVPLGRTVSVDGVPTTYFKRVTGDPHEASPALWRYLYQHAPEYDVLHIHSWWNLLVMVAALVGTHKGARIVLSPRGMLSDYILQSRHSRVKRWAHRLGGKSILSRTFFHATSDQELTECQRLIPAWKGYAIPNIISLPPLSLVNGNGHSPEFTLGFLSRVDPKKGLEMLIGALTHITFPVRLMIAGSGDEAYMERLRDLVASLGLEDKVTWMGWLGQDEKFKALAHFDLMVLPSYNENFANVVLEALHMGTPVCITREVGLSGWVEQEGLGWIAERNDRSLARAITNAYFDQGRLAWVRENGRKIVNEQFSEAALILQYMNMYEAVSS